jgi:hypothetical protein
MRARFRRLGEADRSSYRSRCLLPPLRRKFPRPFAREFWVDRRNHLGCGMSAVHRSGLTLVGGAAPG